MRALIVSPPRLGALHGLFLRRGGTAPSRILFLVTLSILGFIPFTVVIIGGADTTLKHWGMGQLPLAASGCVQRGFGVMLYK